MEVALRLRAIAFDVMDTLVHDPYREALEAATGRPLREIFARRDPGAYPRFECDEIAEAEYWAHYEDRGIAVDVAAFHATRRAGYRWIDGMRGLLAALDGHVQRVGATNYPRWVDELRTGMLAGWLDRVVASCDLGIRKPSPDFYAKLLAELDLAAGEVLFVDDRPDNVAAAEAAGLRAHHFTGAPDLRHRLLTEGLLAE